VMTDPSGRVVAVDAKPEPISVDLSKTAIMVTSSRAAITKRRFSRSSCCSDGCRIPTHSWRRFLGDRDSLRLRRISRARCDEHARVVMAASSHGGRRRTSPRVPS